jgi:C1A family cysteine protease
MKLPRVALLVVVLLSLQACGGGGSNSNSNTSADTSSSATGFYTPSYGDARGNTSYEADLASITKQVIAYQDAGKDLVSNIKVDNSLIQLFGNYKVKLTEASKNSCPSGLSGCDTTDSSALQVGHSALIASRASLTSSIRDQGERGTCVAFALTSATELLLSRQQNSTHLSEQNTYFQAKRQTNTWESAGLNPYDTVDAFVNNQTKWVPHDSWPYNADDKNCSSYNSKYPNATCSATEAQGGGSDTRQQDPTAASSSGYRATTAHQLYASIGRIKQALYRGYPVAIGINANLDFQVATYKGGVVSWAIKADSCGASLCGHEVVAVGYQDSDQVAGGGYLIIKNSWTSDWGDGGLAYVTYEWLQHSLLDAQALVRIDSAK